MQVVEALQARRAGALPGFFLPARQQTPDIKRFPIGRRDCRSRIEPYRSTRGVGAALTAVMTVISVPELSESQANPAAAGEPARAAAGEAANSGSLPRPGLARWLPDLLSGTGAQPYRAIGRYGLAVAMVITASLMMAGMQTMAEKPLAFPFYAAVVASAWIGTGPGLVAVILSALAVEYYWAEPRFSFGVRTEEMPWFIFFILFSVMAFGWSSQRRRTQGALEDTVAERTADLRRSNVALQVEIAERAVAEEELRRSETLLAQGQKLSRTASWTLQLPSGQMRWSAQLFEILGFDRGREEAPSYRAFSERIHPDDRPRFAAALDRAIAGDGEFSCETRILIPDGPTKYVQAVGEVQRDATDGVEFIGTIVDLTERQRTEQALRDTEAELARTLRLATVAELAAAIAHEINQPLAAITANGSACLRSLTQQPPMLDNARDAASCIVTDGHRAADVITRIRALFSKEMPQERLVDLHQTIERVIGLMRPEIDKQRVVARVELAKSPALVMGDPVQLQQVLVNLVTNALEAMTGIANRRRLTIRSEIDRGADVVVTVEDTGRGLDPEQLPRMFDSFYTTKPGGIGVGLAISRSIIEAHGGSLSAAPAPRHGARVGFNLPPASAGHDSPAETNAATPKS